MQNKTCFIYYKFWARRPDLKQTDFCVVKSGLLYLCDSFKILELSRRTIHLSQINHFHTSIDTDLIVLSNIYYILAYASTEVHRARSE